MSGRLPCLPTVSPQRPDTTVLGSDQQQSTTHTDGRHRGSPSDTAETPPEDQVRRERAAPPPSGHGRLRHVPRPRGGRRELPERLLVGCVSPLDRGRRSRRDPQDRLHPATARSAVRGNPSAQIARGRKPLQAIREQIRELSNSCIQIDFNFFTGSSTSAPPFQTRVLGMRPFPVPRPPLPPAPAARPALFFPRVHAKRVNPCC